MSVPIFFCLFLTTRSFTETGREWRNARIFSRSCSLVVNHESSVAARCFSKSSFHEFSNVSSVSEVVSCSKNIAPAISVGVSGSFSEINFSALLSKYSTSEAPIESEISDLKFEIERSFTSLTKASKSASFSKNTIPLKNSFGLSIRRSSISAITPSVPSLPINRSIASSGSALK